GARSGARPGPSRSCRPCRSRPCRASTCGRCARRPRRRSRSLRSDSRSLRFPSSLLGELTLAEHCAQARDVAPYLTDETGVLELHHRALEAELELLLLQLGEARADLGVVPV